MAAVLVAALAGAVVAVPSMARAQVAADVAAIPDVSYVVIVSGSFDLLMEVVCEDDDHLLAILNDKVRAIPGVRSTETFTYLRLDKQTFAWGTR